MEGREGNDPNVSKKTWLCEDQKQYKDITPLKLLNEVQAQWMTNFNWLKVSMFVWLSGTIFTNQAAYEANFT